MITKEIYTEVARTINANLKSYDDGDFKPRCSVVNTEKHGYGFDKWSLMVNDTLYDLLQLPGHAQNLFYADEVYTAGLEHDYYLEPVTRTFFSLAVL